MKRILIAASCVAILASPASAFLNPRTVATLLPDTQNPGYGILRIEVVGRAWICIGRLKMENKRPMGQKVKLDCRGMADWANAEIIPDGDFFTKVNYRLSNGIRGHLTLS